VSKSSQRSIPEDGLEAYDTGIYYDPPRRRIPLDPAKFGHDTVAATRRFSLEGRLEEAEQLARNILTRYRDAQGNLLPPSKKAGVPHNVKRQVDFAVMLLGHIRMVQENVDVANVKGAALCGYYVGMYHGALRVCEVEHVALRGRKVGKGGKKGHEKAHGTPEKKQQKWAAYQDALEKLAAKNQHWSLTGLRKEVAKQFGVSFKTIERHTTPPGTRK